MKIFTLRFFNKKYIYAFMLLGLAFGFAPIATAQVSGTKSIPTDYPSLVAFLTDVNTQGVGAGGVVLNVPSGYTETAPLGGFVLSATGTAANPISITGGTAPKPILTAAATQASGALNDAVFKVIGSDYVTISNLDLRENASNITTAFASNDMTEWGFALLYASATDGANNVSLIGNTITLNRTYANTFGIYANASHDAMSALTTASATGTDGGFNNLKVHGNAISNVNMGILVVGPTAPADYSSGIDIGGSSAGTGNSISDYGTTGTFSAYANVNASVNGILLRFVSSYSVRYNTLTSSNGGTTGGTLRGIYVPSFTTVPAASGTLEISNNSVSLRSAVANGAMLGIHVEANTANTASTLLIANNDFNNTSHTLTASGAITFISSLVPVATLTISGNTFSNLTVNSTGTCIFINQNYTMTSGMSQMISNNSIVGNFNRTGASGTTNFVTTSASSVTGSSSSYINNSLQNMTFTGTSSVTLFSNSDGLSTTVPEKTFTGNLIQNITSGTGSFTGFSCSYWNGNSVFSGNTLGNVTTSGSITGMLFGSSGNLATSLIIENNTVTGLSTAGTTSIVTAISSANSSLGVEIRNNTVHALSSSSSGILTGILITGSSGGTSVHKNKVYDLTTNNAGGSVFGISTTGGVKTFIYNNLVRDLKAPITNAADAVRGISINQTTANANIGVYYNTVYLSASSTGANFGTSGIFHAANATATTGNLDMRNNIIINESTPAGTGRAVAFRRSSSSLANFNAASNRNMLYAGNPDTNRLILFDGTTSTQAMSNYKTAVAPREANSFTGESFSYGTAGSFFISFTPTSADYLKPVAGIVTQVESGAEAIGTPSITQDFAGLTRPAGTGTAPDLGAREFDGTTPAPVIVINSVTPPASTQCTTSARLVSATITSSSGTVTGANLNYAFDAVAQTPVVMTNTSGNIWEGTIPASNPTNAVVTWSITATNSLPLSSSINGSSYSDEPFVGVSAIASSSDTVICLGDSVDLSAQLVKVGTIVSGAGTGTSSASSASPFYHGWGGVKTQYIFRASELLALGLTAGDISQIALTITAVGTATLNDFTLDIGHTAQAAVVTNTPIMTGLTQVYAAAPLTLSAGVLNFPFSTPFVWDGSSNIVLQFNYSNNNGGGSSSTVKTDPSPGFTGSQAIYADNSSASCLYSAPASGQACMSSSSNSTSTTRPNIVFTGNKAPVMSGVSWSDGTSTIGSGNPLSIAPSSTKTYTATITSTGCTFAPAPAVTVTVNPLPTTPTAQNSAQCGAQVPTASVSSTSGLSSPVFNWYDAASGGNLLQSSTATTYTSAVSSTTTFYVKEQNSATSCESNAVSVTVTVASADNISASAAATTFCVATANTLTASNTNPSPNQSYTYTWSGPAGSGAETPLVGVSVSITPTVAGTYVYDLSGQDGGCSALAQITLTVSPFTATVAPTHVTCNGGSDGSFTLASSTCGTSPYTYSVNGGAFGPIPNNLPAGSHSVIAKDANGYTAQSQTITIDQPSDTMSLPTTTGIAVCEGDASAMVAASATIYHSDSVFLYFGLSAQPLEVGGASAFPPIATTPNIIASATLPALPASATIVSSSFNMNGLSAQGGSWQSDLGFGFTGAISQGYAAGTGTANSAGSFNYNGSITPANINTAGGTVDLHYYDKYNDVSAGPDCIFPIGSNVGVLKIVYNYTTSPSISWFAAASGGSSLGTGSPFEVVGTSVLANTNTPGTYTVYAQAMNGACPGQGRIPATITVNANSSSSMTHTACDSYTLNAQTYTASGTYTQTLVNAVGCDSILTLNLTILQSTTGAETVTECDSYTWSNGQTYTSSGTYTQVVPNAVGCDSTISLSLTILSSSTHAFAVAECEEYEAPSGAVYTSSGTYTDIIANAAGCDSVMTITVTILDPSASTISPAVCELYTAPSGVLYNTSGTYTDVISNAAGCDSVITIVLTILESSSTTLTVSSCGDYTAPSGAVYSFSGTYTDVIPNAAGCDSVITIQLTATQINIGLSQNGAILAANESSASFQWLDCNNGFAAIPGATNQIFIADANGSYAVKITKNSCIDTSECETVSSVGLEEVSADLSFVLAPNPAKDYFSLQMTGAQSASIIVFDNQGKRLFVIDNLQDGEKVDVSHLSKGVYIVQIASENGHSVQRLIRD